MVASARGARRKSPALPDAIHDAAAARLGSSVYLFGGGNGTRQLDSIVRVDPAAPDYELDRLAGDSRAAAARMRSSSRFEGVPANRASSAFDGNPDTAWVGDRLHGQAPWIEWRTPKTMRLGRLRLLFRGPATTGKETAAIAEPPRITPRERDVLVALCRPLLTGDAFTEPASIRTIAAELVVSEAAVKQHLSRLYDKFDLGSEREGRRVRLANAAVARGAVTLGDLRTSA